MWNDLRNAISFLTIVPLGFSQGRATGKTFAYYPLVGLMIGILVAFTRVFAPFSSDIQAFLALVVWIVLTGGLHLDGFADSCDGLLATTTPDRRLEIMKDPRTGAWAVIGLMVLLLGKWLFLREVAPALLIIAPVMGRWAMVWLVYAFAYARPSGLGTFFREGLGRTQVWVASMSMAIVLGILAIFAPKIVVCLPIIALFCVAFGRWASTRLGGGITGDVYGAGCECVEIVCLGVMVWASA
jgi:adenosylcobinamide-GDP ribazoletransferase